MSRGRRNFWWTLVVLVLSVGGTTPVVRAQEVPPTTTSTTTTTTTTPTPAPAPGDDALLAVAIAANPTTVASGAKMV